MINWTVVIITGIICYTIIVVNRNSTNNDNHHDRNNKPNVPKRPRR